MPEERVRSQKSLKTAALVSMLQSTQLFLCSQLHSVAGSAKRRWVELLPPSVGGV